MQSGGAVRILGGMLKRLWLWYRGRRYDTGYRPGLKYCKHCWDYTDCWRREK